jgi:O-antigen ligase
METSEAPGPHWLREWVDVFCARAILAVVLCILVWAPLALGGTPPFSFLVIQCLTILAAALWIARIWAERHFRLLWPPICWAVLFFCLYAVARCRSVTVEFAGRQQLVHVLVYGTLFFVILNNLNRKNSAAFVSLTLIAVGFVLAMLALYQFATHAARLWGDARPDQYVGRGSGTFVNPNHLGGFLAIITPLALAYTVMGRFSPTVKVLLAYGAVTMLAGIVVSLSRGGVVAAGVSLAVFCLALLVQGDFWRPALVTLVLLSALGAGLISQTSSLQKRFDLIQHNGKAGDLRPCYWEAAWRLFDRNRTLGIGPGHYDLEFPSVRPLIVQQRPRYVHNDYLNALCEWGLAGLAIIAAAWALLYAGVFQAWRGVRKAPNELGSRSSGRAAFVVGAAVGLLALLVHCVVDFDMQIPAIALTVVTLMALLAAHWRFATERFWINPGRAGKILLTLFVAAAAVWLSAQGLRQGGEAWWLAQAMSASTSGERIVACAIKAHQAEPMDWEANYKLGEFFWSLSLLDKPDDPKRVNEALGWFALAARLNPFDAYSLVGCGMCLDRIGRIRDATPYFQRAARDDPNNSYIALEEGRHCVALADYPAAQRWFERALQHPWSDKGWLDVQAEKQLLERHMTDPIFMAPK